MTAIYEDTVTNKHAECPICFEDLCSEAVGVFTDSGGQRTCQHLFHYECALELPSHICPMCNQPFEKVCEGTA